MTGEAWTDKELLSPDTERSLLALAAETRVRKSTPSVAGVQGWAYSLLGPSEGPSTIWGPQRL